MFTFLLAPVAKATPAFVAAGAFLALMQEPNAYETYWPLVVAAVTTFILPFFLSGDYPGGAVAIIQWFKTKLGLSGAAVYPVLLIVSLVVATIVAIVDGQIEVTGPLTPERFVVIATAVLASTQIWYARLKSHLENPPEETS